jgi:hypothetical protein
MEQLDCPRFSRYCWWYSSARQKAPAGVISVTIGLRNLPDACNRSFDAAATACCSGV